MERGGPGIAPEQSAVSRSDLMRAAGDLEAEPACWTPEHDYQPAEDRSVIRALRGSTGVLSWDDFIVTPTSPAAWAVNVGPGRAIIDGTVAPWLQGSYVVYSPSSRRVPLLAAHPTQERFDVVILHVLDQENSTEEGFGWVREVVAGQPGGGPPELPENSIALYGLRIPAGSEDFITSASFFPPIWPRPGDLRRPAGPTLMNMYAVTGPHIVLGTAQGLQSFNLQIPGAWERLALWPFDVVMETTISVRGISGGNEVMNLNYTPRPGGPAETYQLFNHNPMQHASITWMDFRLFERGQVPFWGLTASATGMGFTAHVQSRTKLYPRSVTTNRAESMTDPVVW